MVVVGQKSGQSAKSSDADQIAAADGHDGAQTKIDGFEAFGLEDVAPKVRVDGEGLPAHGHVGGVGQEVKAIHHAGLLVLQSGNGLLEEVRRDFHIGIADNDNLAAGERFEDGEFGDFAVGAGAQAADDQFGVDAGVFGLKAPDDLTDGILGGGDAEKDLEIAVVLGEPALEAGLGFRVTAVEGLELGARREILGTGFALELREPPSGAPLPQA